MLAASSLDSLSICVAGALCVSPRNRAYEEIWEGKFLLRDHHFRSISASHPLCRTDYTVGLIRETSGFAQMHNEDALIATTSESSPTKLSRVTDNVPLSFEMFPHYNKYVLLWHWKRLKIIRDRFFITRPSLVIHCLVFFYFYFY